MLLGDDKLSDAFSIRSAEFFLHSRRVTGVLWNQLGYLAATVLTGAIFWAINQPLPRFSTVILYALCMGNLVVYPVTFMRRMLSGGPPARRWLISSVALLVLTPLAYVIASLIVIWIAPPSSRSLPDLIRDHWKFPVLAITVYGFLVLFYAETKERLERRNVELQQSVEQGAAQLEQQEQELQRARDVQESLLPREIPQLPRFQIAAAWEPARMVAGDYFDVIPLDHNRLAISIADVAGKGVSAALLMANVQAAVRIFAHDSDSPACVCSGVNRVLGESIAHGKFVTFFYGILDCDSGTFRYCNAGHPGPLLVSADSARQLQGDDAVLGVFPDWKYKDASVELSRGDRLLLFTDGITEALSADEQEFGEDRLVVLGRASASISASLLTKQILAQVRDYCDGNFQDDATLLVIAVN
jgi:sigma-B regulation protein RsbU (phosphoserine phosphatase)